MFCFLILKCNGKSINMYAVFFLYHVLGFITMFFVKTSLSRFLDTSYVRIRELLSRIFLHVSFVSLKFLLSLIVSYLIVVHHTHLLGAAQPSVSLHSELYSSCV